MYHLELFLKVYLLYTFTFTWYINLFKNYCFYMFVLGGIKKAKFTQMEKITLEWLCSSLFLFCIVHFRQCK